MDRLMTSDELSEYLRVPITTLHQWRWKGVGPRAVKVGRHLRYRESDLNAWLEAQSQPAA